MRSRPSSESVNDNDDYIGGFDASTCSVDNLYDIFESEEEIITEDSLFWVNTKFFFGKVGSLKSLSVICQRIQIIKN